MTKLIEISIGHFKSKTGNVGDDLNLWLWPKILKNYKFSINSTTVILGVGSILDSNFINNNKINSFSKKIVIGSGARGIAGIPVLDDSWEIVFVRGPKTVSAISNQRSVSCITDPAYLISDFFKKSKVAGKIGLIPYFLSNEYMWQNIANSCGFTLISPRNNLEVFIKELSECQFVITEAMHGAIFADALRIPWIPYSSFSGFHEGDTHSFKWADWTESMNIECSELTFPIMWDAESKGIKTWVKSKYIAQSLSKLTISSCFLSDDLIYKDKIENLRYTISKL